MVNSEQFDVLVVGCGPAGAAASYWLAREGFRVLAVEKKVFPREKTCGDGLTPRAVYQLTEMGLADTLTRYHRYGGLRTLAHGRSLEMAWPSHPVYPSHGYVVRRCELDTFVADNAAAAGATIWQGAEATAPLWVDGQLVGATVTRKAVGDEQATTVDVRADYVVVADGANSRFGRALGARRDKARPQGMAIRAYYESPLHAEPWIESALDVRDRAGNSMPGYGWIFPVGNGTINVGIGLLSTFRDWKSVNTTRLMTEWAATLPEYWQIDPTRPIAPPTGGRLPMGHSVGPSSGRNWMLVGDAGGSINPFNGEGIDYAYETGRMAASAITLARASGNPAGVSVYNDMLTMEYRDYFKVARLFAQVIGRPVLMRELTRIGMRSQTLMEWVLRIMANLMRTDDPGIPERLYQAAVLATKWIPEK
jgi:geranylgeranyl reductase family protein